ncbi:ABC transporter permease, partial [Fulvivirga lutimaris]|uniref:ABC transporter permease n=1 Tax=Fulvivirga lutimaris TaxID=1819566 RepID=UPI0012BCDB4B
DMIFNFIKIALRNLLNKKVFSIINITGLALGMAACLSIFYYVNYEFSYNKNFAENEKIYRTYFSRDQAGTTRAYMNPGSALKLAYDDVPEIESSFRIINIDYQNYSLIYDDGRNRTALEQSGVKYADPEIEKVLQLQTLAGSFEQLKEPMKVVLSESVANKFFETTEAVGKTITVSGNIGNRDFEIVGVVEDLPANTDFNLSVLLSISSYVNKDGSTATNNWNDWNSETYIKSSKPNNEILTALERDITSRPEFTEGDSKWTLKTLPLSDLHLTTVEQDDTINKSAESLLLGLAAIGVFILVIAWINFINLSTARAIERAREVGVRKALGSQVNQIRAQFLIESLIINFLAALMALTIVQLVLPVIFDIKDLMNLGLEQRVMFWSLFGLILVIGSFLSGLYPAFVLSSFKPSAILKGKLTSSRGGELLRKGLVVFQFSASTLMIIGTYVVYQQLTYMQNKDLGIKIDNVLLLDAPPLSVHGDGDNYKTVNAFKEEIAGLNAVKFMAASSDVPGQETGWSTTLRKPGEPDEDKKTIALLACDRDFSDVYDLQLAAGRFYQKGDGTFDKGTFVINEEALELLGFDSAEEAIGKQLVEGRMFPDLTIVGVVKNFHQQSLKNKIVPMAFVLSSWSNYYSLALNVDQSLPSDQRAARLKSDIEAVNQVWSKFFPEYPFDYEFLDQQFNAQYQSDQEFSFIISLFALLSMIIASLGLLGLASYAVLQRTKEIGIRKVLGASVGRIFKLLSLEYLWLIIISSIIAIPVAYFALGKWLSTYPYKIDITLIMFAIPIILILVIAFITIASQVINATMKNPVESLRHE